MLNIVKIQARDLPDLWFQAVNSVLDNGRKFVIDKGSYEGQTRLEFDYFIGHVLNPSYGSGTPEILPHIPSHLNIPDPVEFEYIYGGEGYSRSYVEYIMSERLEANESYTYGQRLTASTIPYRIIEYRENDFFDSNIMIKFLIDDLNNRNSVYSNREKIQEAAAWYLNQIEWVIDTYKKYGYRNNQMVLQIAQPTDTFLLDPPCLRHIDTRIQDNKLHFFIYFRSWDLWGGLPANLAGIEYLHKYMASEIGVKQGEWIVESKGLHLYGYAEELAKLRCMKA